MKPTDPDHPHHSCMALFERLSEYIDRELDPPTCAEIEAHINACRPCQVCLETLKKTISLCKHMKRQQVPEAFSLKLRLTLSDLANKDTT